MKRKPVANLGLFFSFAFLAGFILVLTIRPLRGLSIISGISRPTNLAQLLAALLFYLSSRSPKLYWIQPAVFLAIAPLPFIASHDNFYGIAFFVLAVLLLFKIGFFNSRRIPKVIGLVLYLYLVQLGIAMIVGRPFRSALTAVFFVTIFLVILYILYQEEIIIYLKEPKPVLDLKEKRLSETEYLYLIDLQSGKSLKEIAFDHDVSESTVRNTLARVYKKLAVKDKSELMA
ncbi:MAG: LuxR C-terminal-related transcriptional regulator, partial [Spirochaetota bacterium]